MPHNLAAPGQARAQDTLRWGSVVDVTIAAAPSQSDLNLALRNAFGKQGKQLVNAHWRWPLAWHVALMVTPYGSIGGDVNVQFNIILGSGDGQQELLRTVSLTATAGGDSAIDDALVLPAADILIVPKIIVTEGEGGHPLTGPGSVQIGAFVAPTTEPHAQLHMLECLKSMCGGADGAGQREGGWMPPGFYPEPLGYQR